jgi:hypothetical protein
VNFEPSLLLVQNLYSCASVTLSEPVKRSWTGVFRVVGRRPASRLGAMNSVAGVPNSANVVALPSIAKLSPSRPFGSTRPLRFGTGLLGSTGSSFLGGLAAAIFLTVLGPVGAVWVLVASTPFGGVAEVPEPEPALPPSLAPPEPELGWPAS